MKIIEGHPPGTTVLEISNEATPLIGVILSDACVSRLSPEDKEHMLCARERDNMLFQPLLVLGYYPKNPNFGMMFAKPKFFPTFTIARTALAQPYDFQGEIAFLTALKGMNGSSIVHARIRKEIFGLGRQQVETLTLVQIVQAYLACREISPNQYIQHLDFSTRNFTRFLKVLEDVLPRK